MLKIAICDDNIANLSNIVSVIKGYQALQRDKNNIKYTAMESRQEYNLVLLDILCPL
jgi:hypothetical protein